MRSPPSKAGARRFVVRLFASLLVLIACGGFATLERLLAPDAELWERWTAHDAASTARVDHGAWDGFLSRNLVPGPDGSTRLAYARVSPSDRALLDEYLKALTATPISRHARDTQLAYWINLYNALTVQVVLDHYPVASIRDIKLDSGLFSSGPWDKKLVEIEGEEISLNDIEHRIIRPVWRDPRVHYALNCASIGCPSLSPKAFTSEDLDARLTQAATAFVNSPLGVQVADGQITVSRIYDWFHEDFGVGDAAVFEHILKFAMPELREMMQSIGKINNVAYDWKLNDAG